MQNVGAAAPVLALPGSWSVGLHTELRQSSPVLHRMPATQIWGQSLRFSNAVHIAAPQSTSASLPFWTPSAVELGPQRPPPPGRVDTAAAELRDSTPSSNAQIAEAQS
jgi:hypothetical protein